MDTVQKQATTAAIIMHGCTLHKPHELGEIATNSTYYLRKLEFKHITCYVYEFQTPKGDIMSLLMTILHKLWFWRGVTGWLFLCVSLLTETKESHKIIIFVVAVVHFDLWKVKFCFFSFSKKWCTKHHRNNYKPSFETLVSKCKVL